MTDEETDTPPQQRSVMWWIIYWIIGIIALALFLGAIWMPAVISIWNWLWGGGPPVRPVMGSAPLFVMAIWMLKSTIYFGYLIGAWLFPVIIIASGMAEAGDTPQQVEETKEAKPGGISGRSIAAIILFLPALFALLWLQHFVTNFMYACFWGDECQIFLAAYGLG